jgi:hypothetical protein
MLALIARATRDVDVVAPVDMASLTPSRRYPIRCSVRSRTRRSCSVFRRSGSTQVRVRSSIDGCRKEYCGEHVVASGAALILYLADRRDQVFFKFDAAVDQGPRSQHFENLRRLEPTADELGAAAAWARTHDPSEGFRVELRGALRDLGVVDGDL